MNYLVTAIGYDTITIWDQTTRDPDHPNERAGQITFHVGSDHPWRINDIVYLLVRSAGKVEGRYAKVA